MSHDDQEHGGASFPLPAQSPFVRQSELADIEFALGNEDCQAVILRYDTGLGASSILRHLAVEISAARAVLTIHGTPSLSAVPYGAFAPLLGDVTSDDLSIRTNVFRAVLGAIAASREVAHGSGLPLVIVDDAHAVDRSTAELLVTLVLSGTIKLLASHRRNLQLPEPLPRLWSGGSAETIDLYPLTRDQGHEFLQAMLGAPVALPTSWYFWSCSGGNPMLLKMLVAEAFDDELLTQSRGIWVYRLGHHRVGRNLRDVVRAQIRGLSGAAESALDLVALAEPVSRDMVEQISGKEAVDELLGRQLVQSQFLEENVLRLANPIYGEVIRQMVPPAHSRILHDSLLEKLQTRPMGTEALLRRVSWAVDSGLEVPPEQLLRAALIACKLSQPTLALELLDGITATDPALKVRAVQARAHYMLGRYEKAAGLLDDAFDAASNLDELLFGALLRATTRLALGMPAASMEADINKLQDASKRLMATLPEQADTIRDNVLHKTALLELMVLSHKGDYGRMLPLIETVLAGSPALSDDEMRVNTSIALAMDAERLCALGLATQSQQRSAEAFAIEHSELYDVFFIPEMIVFRQLTTALCSGDLPFAASLLDQFFVDAGPVIITFGGGANVARGMGLIRQGLLQDAVDALLPAIESLRDSDPQQLLGFCTSMAAYTAAKLGQRDLAARLIGEHEEKPAMFLVTAHERAYMAAAHEYHARDGAGLAALLALADVARDQQAPLLELNALAIAAELGEKSVLDRLLQISQTVEGAWSEAIMEFGQQLSAPTKNHAASQTSTLTQGSSPQMSQDSWFTATVFDAAPLTPNDAPPAVPRPAARSALALGSAVVAKGAPVQLTRREREIAMLAVEGLSDRAIAEKLYLSARTVGGHLYRCYAKLGISGRDELTAELFF
ncbi:LuxR C-terminal-related transcriptional regulator [Arthrobacter sp. HLT1-20]